MRRGDDVDHLKMCGCPFKEEELKSENILLKVLTYLTEKTHRNRGLGVNV